MFQTSNCPFKFLAVEKLSKNTFEDKIKILIAHFPSVENLQLSAVKIL